MALMVVTTRESGKYFKGPASYHAQNPLVVPTGAPENVETSNSDLNGDMVNKFQNMNRYRYLQSTGDALGRNKKS